jgi:hypothetical protein
LQKQSSEKKMNEGKIKKGKIKSHTQRIKSRKKSKKKTVIENNTKENFDSKNNVPKIEDSKVNDTNQKLKFHRTKNNNNIQNQETELEIDFNFEKFIVRRDEDIDFREINSIPFRQALRIDKRSFIKIFVSIVINKIGALSLFYCRHQYSHFSLDLSIYLFELLLDLAMNCILYTEDVVSEKYNNQGELSMFTSLYLSVISNIVSSLIILKIRKIIFIIF